MIFLIPILIIIAILFGIDYLYFNDDKNTNKTKQELNISIDDEKQKHIKELFKKQ
ncbi:MULTISPECIES: hypothetical protein [unclassified Campylobacter]|uniref:hypothetical protein n=1 Tax=unclassified Campylobacter TaxID=2593542 RepID=UPI00137F7F87|nr:MULTISPECIES: hypothetical protein [unclassified Campylobacter]KAA8604388.1 hypothetical protein CGP82_02370 [Campylobacter sp. LR185c]